MAFDRAVQRSTSMICTRSQNGWRGSHGAIGVAVIRVVWCVAARSVATDLTCLCRWFRETRGAANSSLKLPTRNGRCRRWALGTWQKRQGQVGPGPSIGLFLFIEADIL
jgi:hypothetical protein